MVKVWIVLGLKFQRKFSKTYHRREEEVRPFNTLHINKNCKTSHSISPLQQASGFNLLSLLSCLHYLFDLLWIVSPCDWWWNRCYFSFFFPFYLCMIDTSPNNFNPLRNLLMRERKQHIENTFYNLGIFWLF